MTNRDPAAAIAAEPLRDVRYPDRGPRPSWRRRIGVGVLSVVVLAGALGLLGVRSSTATASGGGYVLVLTYPKIARAGLDVPWRAEVRRDGGFEDEVTLRVTAAYFHMFETQGFSPEPSAATADASYVYLTFDPPPGEDFVVDFDAYIQPSSQVGKRGEVAVVVDGAPMATVSFSTWLVP